MAHNSYSTGFGPSAYDASCPWSVAAACGERFYQLNVDTKTFERDIEKAKANRCVAFVVEIVQATGGAVLSAEQWQRIVQACQKHRMILVVDEAMTAVRCGAPFAHQLPCYREYGRPDFVFFGKGIQTCGVAIDWKGVNATHLGMVTRDDQVAAVVTWQKRFTELAPPESLLQSWGTIVMAKKQNWPQRAVQIGEILRSVLYEVGVKSCSVKGLHSLIYFSQSDPGPKYLHVVPASAGSLYARWLPVLDAVMCSTRELHEKVFGFSSSCHRRQLARYLRKHGWDIGYCSRCGDNMEIGDDRPGARERCEVCLVRPCEQCEPGDHMCQFQELGKQSLYHGYGSSN